MYRATLDRPTTNHKLLPLTHRKMVVVFEYSNMDGSCELFKKLAEHLAKLVGLETGKPVYQSMVFVITKPFGGGDRLNLDDVNRRAKAILKTINDEIKKQKASIKSKIIGGITGLLSSSKAKQQAAARRDALQRLNKKLALKSLLESLCGAIEEKRCHLSFPDPQGTAWCARQRSAINNMLQIEDCNRPQNQISSSWVNKEQLQRIVRGRVTNTFRIGRVLLGLLSAPLHSDGEGAPPNMGLFHLVEKRLCIYDTLIKHYENNKTTLRAIENDFEKAKATIVGDAHDCFTRAHRACKDTRTKIAELQTNTRLGRVAIKQIRKAKISQFLDWPIFGGWVCIHA